MIQVEGIGAGGLEVQHLLQSALGITIRRLDLDNVGAEIGENRTGGRHEGPGRDLEDADSLDPLQHEARFELAFPSTTGMRNACPSSDTRCSLLARTRSLAAAPPSRWQASSEIA